MDVVVWALWIWIALSAVALVIYVFRRVRYNRRRRAAVLDNQPLPTNPDAATSKAKTPEEPLAQRTPKKLKNQPVPTKPIETEATASRISSTPSEASEATEPAGGKATPLFSGAGRPKTIKAETDAKPTGPPIIFNNSTAATSEPEATKPTPATTPVGEETVKQIGEEIAKPDSTEPSSGLFSMSSLLAPRSDTPTADPPEADVSSTDAPEIAADQSDADQSDADITLPADEKLDLDLATPSTPPEPTKTLADVLAGIRLPYDLFPVDEPDPQIADVAVTLVTMTTPAGQVGMAVADELERLGYEIFSLSDSEAVAKRGTDATGNPEDVLSLVIRTDVGPKGQPIGSANADQALPSAVAVDIWVGGGESPLQTSHRTSLEI